MKKNMIQMNGRFLMKDFVENGLAYPKSIWLREGSMHFKRWGEKTDGKGTPWCFK